MTSGRRVVGIDLGSRRIGVAVSDPGGVIASPYAVLERGPSPAQDYQRVAELVRGLEAGRVVVGLPLSLSGEPGPAAVAAQQEVDALSEVLDVPVETHDERLTTVSANRAMLAVGTRRAARRRAADKVAAAVMLQSWLDRRRP